jgi:hypothetical protein
MSAAAGMCGPITLFSFARGATHAMIFAASSRRAGSLFDHLVGAGEQRGRDSEAVRLSGFEVDHPFNLH